MNPQMIKNTIAKTKKLKVLYVEDNPIARKGMLETLSIFFDEIAIADDGVDGLESFKNNSYDLIITDINMPRMNGIEMMKKIREVDSDIILIVLSAHNEDEFFEKSAELNITGYLFKPLNIVELMTILEQIS